MYLGSRIGLDNQARSAYLELSVNDRNVIVVRHLSCALYPDCQFVELDFHLVMRY